MSKNFTRTKYLFQPYLMPADNINEAISQLSRLVVMSGTLNSINSVFMKLANYVRFLTSGQRSHYIRSPFQKTSMVFYMPGKVDPIKVSGCLSSHW